MRDAWNKADLHIHSNESDGLASPAQMFRDHARLNTMTVEELDQRLQDGYRKNLY